MKIINQELYEALRIRYMSRWYEEVNYKGNTFIFKCIGEAQWDVYKNENLINRYSFHYYEIEDLNKELDRIFEI